MPVLNVAALGGEVKSYFVPEDTPLLPFLREKGFTTEGNRVELSGQVADEGTEVTEDSTAIFTPNMKGGLS